MGVCVAGGVVAVSVAVNSAGAITGTVVDGDGDGEVVTAGVGVTVVVSTRGVCVTGPSPPKMPEAIATAAPSIPATIMVMRIMARSGRPLGGASALEPPENESMAAR